MLCLPCLAATYCYRCNAIQPFALGLQDVAERVAREAQLLLYSPAVMSMDSYPIQQLPEERFVIFVTATTGQVTNSS